MSKQTKAVPFWQSLSLAELAELQGVSPVEDLDDLAELWPTDDDPDDLLQYILTLRAERRELTRGGD
jgi:hypothetical protein